MSADMDRLNVKGSAYTKVYAPGIERVMLNGECIGTIEPAGTYWIVRDADGEMVRSDGASGLWMYQSIGLRVLAWRAEQSDEIVHWSIEL